MKIFSLFICMVMLCAPFASAQKVWSSAKGTVTFAKTAFADRKLAANQDRITDSVWITRASTQSLFNIRKDTSYKTDAPSGTLWALGKTDSFATLTYKTFVTLSGGSPQGLVGKDLVLKCVAENIYIDIKFLSCAGGNTGGSFSYTRAAAPLAAVTEMGSVPNEFALMQNYPNPFNPSTSISFTLHVPGFTTLTIFDAVGREVAVLLNEHLEAGVLHQRTFDASGLASGTYYARLVSSGEYRTRKLFLVK